jgi:hypothetical protein
MAYENWGLEIPLQVSPNAGSGIAQYAAVKLDAAASFGDCLPGAANTDAIVGFNQDAGGPTLTLGGTPPVASSGQSIRVRISGMTKANAGGAISLGDLLVVGAAGVVNTAPALAATSVHIVGQAMEAAVEAGDIITVLLFPMASSIVNA